MVDYLVFPLLLSFWIFRYKPPSVPQVLKLGLGWVAKKILMTNNPRPLALTFCDLGLGWAWTIRDLGLGLGIHSSLTVYFQLALLIYNMFNMHLLFTSSFTTLIYAMLDSY